MAITLGAGGIGITHATTSSGEKPIYKPINPCRLADLRPAPNTVGTRDRRARPRRDLHARRLGHRRRLHPPDRHHRARAQRHRRRPHAADVPAPVAGRRHATDDVQPQPDTRPTTDTERRQRRPRRRPVQFSVFNRFGTVNVIIDVVGVYDDHNHDDRYYTEDEADAAFARQVAGQRGGNRRFDDDTTIITTVDEIVATVTVDTPTSGYVIVNSGNYVLRIRRRRHGSVRIRPDRTVGSYLQIEDVANLDVRDDGRSPRGSESTRSCSTRRPSRPITSSAIRRTGQLSLGDRTAYSDVHPRPGCLRKARCHYALIRSWPDRDR